MSNLKNLKNNLRKLEEKFAPLAEKARNDRQQQQEDLDGKIEEVEAVYEGSELESLIGFLKSISSHRDWRSSKFHVEQIILVDEQQTDPRIVTALSYGPYASNRQHLEVYHGQTEEDIIDDFRDELLISLRPDGSLSLGHVDGGTGAYYQENGVSMDRVRDFLWTDWLMRHDSVKNFGKSGLGVDPKATQVERVKAFLDHLNTVIEQLQKDGKEQPATGPKGPGADGPNEP